MSTSTFIDQLYSKFLYRDADAAGKAYWQNSLDSGTVTAEQATLSFVNSAEYQNTAAALSKLYFLVFNRIPDNEGLTYWVNAMQNGESMANIAASFAQSEEFATAYADATTNASFLDQLYQNAFNRNADSNGKAYWEGKMTEGFSQADVINSFAASAEFDEVAGSNVQTTAIYYGILGRIPTATELAAAGTDKAALITTLYNSSDYSGEALPDQLSGKLIDGYIKDATVFLDANGNGLLDEGETSTKTDETGDFTLSGQGNLVAFGGTDISTGLAFEGTLKAPAGSTVITPTTTLIAEIVESGKSVEEATQAVVEVLDLPADVDLKTFDPIEEATKEGADATDVANALSLQKANVQIANMMVQSAAVVTGASQGEVDTAQAMHATVQTLAEKITEAAGTTTKVDLADATLVEETVNQTSEKTLAFVESDTVKEQFKKTVKELADETAKVLSDANKQIGEALDNADSSDTTAITKALVDAVKVQTVTQGSAAEAIEQGAKQGDLSKVEDNFSGDKLTEEAKKVEVSNDAVTGNINSKPTEPEDLPTEQSSTGGSSSGGTSGGSARPVTNVTEGDGYYARDIDGTTIINAHAKDTLVVKGTATSTVNIDLSSSPDKVLLGNTAVTLVKNGQNAIGNSNNVYALELSGTGLDVTGNDAKNYLNLTDQDDVVSAGQGDDRIYGHKGADRLIGDEGSDRFRFNEGDSTVSQTDTIVDFSPQGERDRIELKEFSGYDYHYDSTSYTDLDSGLTAAREVDGKTVVTFSVTAGEQTDSYLFIASSSGNPAEDNLIKLENYDSLFDDLGSTGNGRVRALFLGDDEDNSMEHTGNLNSLFDGGSGNDAFSGGSGYDYIYGNEGNDSLDGGAGGDWLEGGSGDDHLDGGEDFDVAYYYINTAEFNGSLQLRQEDSTVIVFDGSGDLYSVVLNADGTGTVIDLRTENHDDGTDTLSNIEQVTIETNGADSQWLEITRDDTGYQFSGTNVIDYQPNANGDGFIGGTANDDLLEVTSENGFDPSDTDARVRINGGEGDDTLIGGDSYEKAEYSVRSDEINGLLKAKEQADGSVLVSDNDGPLYRLTLNTDGSGTVEDLRTDSYDEGSDSLTNIEAISIGTQGDNHQWLEISVSDSGYRFSGTNVIDYRPDDNYIGGTPSDDVLDLNSQEAIVAGFDPFTDSSYIRIAGQEGNDTVIGAAGTDSAGYDLHDGEAGRQAVGGNPE